MKYEIILLPILYVFERVLVEMTNFEAVVSSCLITTTFIVWKIYSNQK